MVPVAERPKVWGVGPKGLHILDCILIGSMLQIRGLNATLDGDVGVF